MPSDARAKKGRRRISSALARLREILGAIRSAKIPAQPERTYDLLGEAVARPFGESGGRGRIREGGRTSSEGKPTHGGSDAPEKRATER